ncbi:hypothetical protein TNCV_1765201 [Trichonephila clavipes]|nr:hypothetical protein TNCV_1765201 [Trichonephila clavipes]
MDDPICYELRVISIATGTSMKWYSSKSFLSPSRLHWSYLSVDNARPYVTKTVRDFCSAQRMQCLPWPAYLPDMSPIEHV